MERDPVCGKEITDTENILVVVYYNFTYAFCSHTCKIKFLMNPEKYIIKNNSDTKDK